MSQLDDVLDLVVDVLGRDDVIGAYPHGSAVLGVLRSRSDLDVLVLIDRPTTEAERRSITDGLLAISGRRRRHPDDRPVELTIVVQSEVRPWRYPPRSDYQYGEWLRAEYAAGLTPGPVESPDIAPLLTMVLQGGQALFGPSPGDVFDPVPASDLRRAIVEGIPGLLADLEGDEANVLLTFARIWTTLATGQIVSKDAAANWVLERLPVEHRPVIEQARDVYLGTADDRWDGQADAVRVVVAVMTEAIEALESSAAAQSGDATHALGPDPTQ